MPASLSVVILHFGRRISDNFGLVDLVCGAVCRVGSRCAKSGGILDEPDEIVDKNAVMGGVIVHHIQHHSEPALIGFLH